MPEAVKWIVHDAMLHNTSYQNLPEIIKSLGYDCYIVYNHPMMDDLDSSLQLSGCVIPYCGVTMARKFKQHFGLYLNENNLKYHVYTSLLGLDYDIFLNDHANLTTFSNYRKRRDYWFNKFTPTNHHNENLFIRPDSGIKIFTGHVVNYDEFEFDNNALEKAITDDSLIWIGPVRHFWDETRFIICGNQVIDGSRYATQNGNELIEDKNFPQEFWALAETVAKCTWKPDEIFTVDICMTKSGPKIVEVNSGSCSSWYACDPVKIVKAISEHTLKLWNEQYE